MREILYRGKSNQTWYTGTLYYTGDDNFYNGRSKLWLIVNPEDGIEVRVSSNTIGQFVGMTDTKGTKIFEGDILTIDKAPYTIEEGIAIYGVAAWDNDRCAFMLEMVDNPKLPKHFAHIIRLDFLKLELMNCRFEIVGNIYDNPELFEVQI